MIKGIPEKIEDTREPKPSGHYGEDLDEAFERIYELYAGDLEAFFRDAHKEAELKAKEAVEKPKVHLL
jgi:hypothetical protein